LTLNQTRENLEAMIQGLQNAGATVVLAGITLPRNYGPDYIDGFEQIYRDLAAQYQLAFLPFLLERVALNAETEDLMQDDGIHPRPAGNAIVARNVFETIEPVLKKLP
jgi:acyl-CoA thioesterase I